MNSIRSISNSIFTFKQDASFFILKLVLQNSAERNNDGLVSEQEIELALLSCRPLQSFSRFE